MNPIYRGDNSSYTLSFKNNDGTPIDITGWKIYFTMKQHLFQSDEDAALKVDVIVHDDPVNGKTSIYLTNGLTEKLEPITYLYDIQVKKPDNTVLTIIVDKVEVKADITRRET